MPKKTKAQKMKTQRRISIAETTAVSIPAPVPGLGHFWTRKDGLRLLLVSEPDTDQAGVAVTFCCIDEWRDGLFKFFIVGFDEPATVANLMQESPFVWIRGDADQSLKTLGIGLRTLNLLGKQPPEPIVAFQASLGNDSKVQLPPGVFPCPACDTPLPPESVGIILESAQSDVQSYMVCDRCQRKRSLGIKRINYAIPMHNRLKNAFLEAEEFTLTPTGWDAMERALPTESAPEAIGLMLVQNVMQGIAYAIERSIADAAVPNFKINDSHVAKALEVLKDALDQEQELKAVDPYEVTFLLEALDEGMALVKQIFREEIEKEPDKQSLVAATDLVLGSVRRHAGREPEKRNYIQFICDYV